MNHTMTQEELIATVCRLAADQAGMEPAEVSLDNHFIQDLNYDSLDQVEFTMSAEDTFQVDIPDEMAEKVRTVRDACEMLTTLLNTAKE